MILVFLKICKSLLLSKIVLKSQCIGAVRNILVSETMALQPSNRSKLAMETLSSIVALVNSFQNMPFLCLLFLFSSDEARVYLSGLS